MITTTAEEIASQLERGEAAFRTGDYARARMLAEDARALARASAREAWTSTEKEGLCEQAFHAGRLFALATFLERQAEIRQRG